MAIIPPPLLPSALSPQGVTLKPQTRARLWQARARQRVTPGNAQGASITLYQADKDGCDFLAYLWASLHSRQEHLSTFGALAEKPVTFINHAAACAIYVIHSPDSAWQMLDGVMAIAWSDDAVPLARIRLTFYVFPEYRHPRLTRQLCEGMLRHLFQVRLFENVWGLVPVENRLAVRFLSRQGFLDTTLRPKALLDPVTKRPVDALEVWLRRQDWEALQAEHQHEGGDHDVPMETTE